MPSWIKQNKATAAAAIAPVIRALQDEAACISFKEEDMATPSRDAIMIEGAACDSLEDLYAELKSRQADGPAAAVAISGLGCFSISQVPADKRQGRLSGRICLVTGAAQGFGEGIARELAAAGGIVVIADLNEPAARKVATSLNEQYGAGTALPLRVDVGNEEAVRQMVEAVVLALGGIDLLVSNAGVLRAGGLEEMELETFEFVTRINYTAFFLVSKYASRPMKLQARFDPDYTADIVQINSKSGLEGSNRNFAYAGGKFGGIGLVQSFAKELVSDRIKVNAICPGNYYEGPLWSDPENGLFVQYLKAGKVPGAASVDDVYRFYVEKVPMRRGCSPRDVARAIFYCVEQTYETGQAIPVTGGQNMLK